MTQRFTIDRARPGEGSRVACLIAGSIPARLRPLTIWGSPQAGRYVESLLEGGSGDGQHEFYLLRRNAEPLGIAALRMMDGKAFLNHLYIAPEWRGRSLGARLLAEATAMYISDHCAGSVALDVFAGR